MTGPLIVIPTGEEQHVIVQMLDDCVYKAAEVAQAKTLKIDDAFKDAWQNTHRSISVVEQTNEGLVA